MKLEEISLKESEKNKNEKKIELRDWILYNWDKIFASAPNKEIYAVVIYQDKKPIVHYFNDKEKEAIPFIKKCLKKQKICNFIYRYQKEAEICLWF